MKLFMIAFLSLFIISCEISPAGSKVTPEKVINKNQSNLNKLLGDFKASYENAPSELAKNDTKATYEKNIDSYLSDTLHNCLNKFQLHIEKVDYFPWRGITALMFKGNFDNIEYWTEQHFKDETSMKESGLYKFLSGLKEGSDTIVSLIYLPKLDIGTSVGTYTDARIEVIPIPDSIAISYKQSHQLPAHFKKTIK